MLLNSPGGASDRLPASYRQRIEEALPVARAAAAPASGEAFAVAMNEFVEWIVTFGVVPLPDDKESRGERIGAIVSGYRDALADIPSDLIVKAVRGIIRHATFRVLPLPGDIRKMVAAELAERKIAVLRLEAARKFGSFESPVAPADRLAPGKMASLAREIAAVTLPRLPGSETPEAGERPAISRADADRQHAAEVGA